ncbi:MAG: hypothetical protein JSU75_08525 [Gammaproteobacteria bacterium]|nr:MAG: hypothetical protein JSU75_08525 [Gammaproteobacteria bacterium]
MRRLISLALLLLLVTGCGTVDDKKKSMTLQSTIRAYESTIRWADFEAASSFINPEVVTEPGPDPSVLKGIKVTSYVSTISGVSEDGTEAHVVAEIQYYNDRSMSVMVLTDQQIWRYDAEVKKWYLAVPLPAFK